MEKVAITGETSGIGLAAAKALAKAGYEIQGFSRASGFDLESSETISKIVEQSRDCSVFINNAFADWAQVELLYSLFEKWKDQDKIILNIGSQSSDGIKDFTHKYAIQKSALDRACEQLNNVPGTKCRVVNIRPGWVRTPRIAELNVQEPQLEADDVSSVLLWILNLPKHVQITSLSLQAR